MYKCVIEIKDELIKQGSLAANMRPSSAPVVTYVVVVDSYQ